MDNFLVALALVFVIEGLLPFLSPRTMRNYMKQMLEMDEKTVRISGLLMMLFGLGMLVLLK